MRPKPRQRKLVVILKLVVPRYIFEFTVFLMWALQAWTLTALQERPKEERSSATTITRLSVKTRSGVNQRCESED